MIENYEETPRFCEFVIVE